MSSASLTPDGGGPHDRRHAFGTDALHHALEPVAFSRRFDLARHAGVLAGRHQNQVAARQRDVRRDARALEAARLLDDLHQDVVAALDLLADREAAVALRDLDVADVQRLLVDVVDVQKGVAPQADVDEGRSHSGEHVLDFSFVDRADDFLFALDVEFGETRRPRVWRPGFPTGRSRSISRLTNFPSRRSGGSGAPVFMPLRRDPAGTTPGIALRCGRRLASRRAALEKFFERRFRRGPFPPVRNRTFPHENPATCAFVALFLAAAADGPCPASRIATPTKARCGRHPGRGFDLGARDQARRRHRAGLRRSPARSPRTTIGPSIWPSQTKRSPVFRPASPSTRPLLGAESALVAAGRHRRQARRPALHAHAYDVVKE